MGQLKQTENYHCDNDCEQSGCPGHTAILEFNSVANIYHFNDGNGQEIYLDMATADVMIKMFKFYSESRADTVKV